MVGFVSCTVMGCNNEVPAGQLRCDECIITGNGKNPRNNTSASSDVQMSSKYPKYYKPIPPGTTDLDVYGVCQMFPVKDDTGCINHARKKLLVPGTRTGGKSFRDDIKEARDTLTRWLELNPVGEFECCAPGVACKHNPCGD